MILLIQAIFVFCIHLYICLSLGSLMNGVLKCKRNNFLQAFITGFFIYFSIFEIIALPLILSKCALSTLSVIWIVFCILCCVGATWLYRKRWIKRLKDFWRGGIKVYWGWIGVVCVAVLGQLIMVVCNQYITADSAYYIGMATTAVHTNTMEIFSPYTGQIQNAFELRYIFSTYPMHNAVFSQVFGLHPLIQTRTVMSGIVILMVNALYYLIGSELFRGDSRKAILFVVALLCINLSIHSIYTNAAFLFYRTYEGKAIIGNVFMSMIVYCVILLYQNRDDRWTWWSLFFVSASCVAISSSGMFLVPFALFAGLFPLVLYTRKMKIFRNTVLVILPVCVYFLIYFLCSLGILTLPAI